MRETPVNRVRWSGERSVREVEETLQRCGHVEIQLAPDFHHALFARLHPEGRPPPLEQIDETDGADLLHKVATIRGLDDLQILEPTVRERNVTVHLLSPVPLIILSLPTSHA